VLYLGFSTYTYDGAATVNFCLPASEWKEVVKFEFTIHVLLTNTPDNVTAEIDLNLRQSTWPPPGYLVFTRFCLLGFLGFSLPV
jgi:hypothetical protein